ncbi:MAG: 50S ribosomal protein L9 [Chloroflexota bacterium]|nr:50S ribosomal protein L9 [Chloroflexota bacterium]
MRVVFVQDVPDVGQVGDVKDVANGHARNYLFPKGFAVLATPDELKRIEARKKAALKLRAEQQEGAQGIAQSLEEVSLAFSKRAGSKGNMYGSVSATAIYQELKNLGHKVEKPMIKLDEPIRKFGTHEVQINLMKDVTATIKVVIEPVSGTAEESTRETSEETIEDIAEDTIEETATEES